MLSKEVFHSLSRSSIFRKCIECLGFATGPFSKNCSQTCKSINDFEIVETLPPGKPCDVRDVENCRVFFTIKQLDGEDNYSAQILKTRGKRRMSCATKKYAHVTFIAHRKQKCLLGF